MWFCTIEYPRKCGNFLPAGCTSIRLATSQCRSERLASRSLICNGLYGKPGGRLQEPHGRKKHGKADHTDPQENAPWDRDRYHRVKEQGEYCKSTCPQLLA